VAVGKCEETHHLRDAGQYRLGELADCYPNFLNGKPQYPVEVRLLNAGVSRAQELIDFTTTFMNL
jgi:hypothetical protein